MAILIPFGLLLFLPDDMTVLNSPALPYTRIKHGNISAGKIFYNRQQIWPVSTTIGTYSEISLVGGHYLIKPEDDHNVGNPNVGGLIYCHGFGSTPVASVSIDILHEIVRLLRRPMLIANTGGVGWGNAATLTAMEGAVTRLGIELGNNTNRLAIIGGSMGGASMAVYARAHPEKVECLLGWGPVTDLTDIVINNRGPGGGYADDINAAYAGGWSEGVYGALHNPITIAINNGFDGIRYKSWYSESDAICTDDSIASMIANIPGADGAKLPGGGHNVEMSTGIKLAAEAVDFITRAAALPITWYLAGKSVYTFRQNGIYDPGVTPKNVRYLIVGGGGGCGSAYGSGSYAGAGGGGEVKTGTALISNPTPVIVGRGGMGGVSPSDIASQGENGHDSSFNGVVAKGGGAGGGTNSSTPFTGQINGASHGTGGGGGINGLKGLGDFGGDGTDALASLADRYRSGAGGGAGADAVNGKGGDGISSDITGVACYYGGGGEACRHSPDDFPGTFGAGLGGGGTGSQLDPYIAGTDGIDGLGGGAGGQTQNGPSLYGGVGIVIVREL